MRNTEAQKPVTHADKVESAAFLFRIRFNKLSMQLYLLFLQLKHTVKHVQYILFHLMHCPVHAPLSTKQKALCYCK